MTTTNAIASASPLERDFILRLRQCEGRIAEEEGEYTTRTSYEEANGVDYNYEPFRNECRVVNGENSIYLNRVQIKPECVRTIKCRDKDIGNMARYKVQKKILFSDKKVIPFQVSIGHTRTKKKRHDKQCSQ